MKVKNDLEAVVVVILLEYKKGKFHQWKIIGFFPYAFCCKNGT